MYFSTAQEMEKLDELAVANGLEIRQMMELAGWLIIPTLERLQIKSAKPVIVVCGKGNKGGDGLAAARHLSNHGYAVEVILVSLEIKPDPQHHLELLRKMGVKAIIFSENKTIATEAIKTAEVVIDALLGYHIEGNPRGDFAELINIINQSSKTVVAYDLPSGVHPTTGQCLEPCIQADATLTLALAKRLFQTPEGQAKSGRVFLGDIGIPAFLYEQIEPGIRPDFGGDGLIEI